MATYNLTTTYQELAEQTGIIQNQGTVKIQLSGTDDSPDGLYLNPDEKVHYRASSTVYARTVVGTAKAVVAIDKGNEV